MFEWTVGNAYNMIVTIYPNNLTLNSYASSHFKDVRYCLLGINSNKLQLAIRPVTKNEIDLKIIKLENLHKVSIGKGYARISNKNIINEISVLLNMDISAQKFKAEYDERENMLIVDLSTVI